MTAVVAEPVVDVLLPVYNGAATVEESIRSVLKQSMPRFRVLAVDDGSSDETPAILEDLARKDARVTILRKSNSGIVDALNWGLKHATAPYVARQDADDISVPDRFAREIDALERQPDVIAVSGACDHIDVNGAITGTRYVGSDPGKADFASFPSREPYLLHPFLMARRQALEAVGGYRYVHHSEDTDLYWRLREIGGLQNLPDVMGFMRVHEGSISNASLQNGRIMAVHSQLAAISARRRAEGRPDLEFAKASLAKYKEAAHLRAMLDIAGRSLTMDERLYLKSAAAVKLLELAAGRHYEPSAEDCALIREVYAALPSSKIGRRSTANWAYRTTVARLLRSGHLRSATALMDAPTLFRTFGLRVFG